MIDPSPEVLAWCRYSFPRFVYGPDIPQLQWAGLGDEQELKYPFAIITLGGSGQRENNDQWDVIVRIEFRFARERGDVIERLHIRDQQTRTGQRLLAGVYNDYVAKKADHETQLRSDREASQNWIPGVHVFGLQEAFNQPLIGEEDESNLVQETGFVVSARLINRAGI